MASSYTHTTALKIYRAIAKAGDRGVDIIQLQKATSLAENTLRTYARWLQKDGAISITEINSKAKNRTLKNLYRAIREPNPQVSEQQRLRRITALLEPFSENPKVWDKNYKGEVVAAIQEAIRIAS